MPYNCKMQIFQKPARYGAHSIVAVALQSQEVSAFLGTQVALEHLSSRVAGLNWHEAGMGFFYEIIFGLVTQVMVAEVND